MHELRVASLHWVECAIPALLRISKTSTTTATTAVIRNKMSWEPSSLCLFVNLPLWALVSSCPSPLSIRKSTRSRGGCKSKLDVKGNGTLLVWSPAHPAQKLARPFDVVSSSSPSPLGPREARIGGARARGASDDVRRASVPASAENERRKSLLE